LTSAGLTARRREDSPSPTTTELTVTLRSGASITALIFASDPEAQRYERQARYFAGAAGQHVVVARSGNGVATWPAGTAGADVAALRRCL
jgi:hypothetical protein